MNNLLVTDNGSIAKVLLLFYVIIASGYTQDLMGKQLRTYLSQNRIAQHIIAFIMMLVLIMIVGGVTDLRKAGVYTIIGYLWFIVTTKLDIQWNFIIILALLAIFFYENNIDKNEVVVINDENLSSKEIAVIQNNNEYNKTTVVICIITITVIGSLLYLLKKNDQYGSGDFDIVKFVFY